MKVQNDPLLSLIRGVRRRWMLALAGRLLVITTMIVAIAVAVMSLTLRLTPIAFETRHLALASGVVVLAIVAIGVLRRWPGDARVARHIDAALELRELLATGLASTGDDAASRTVRGSAVEVARKTTPAQVPERFPSPSACLSAVLLMSASLTTNSLMNAAAEPEIDRSRLPFDPRRGDRILTELPASAMPTMQRPDPSPQSDVAITAAEEADASVSNSSATGTTPPRPREGSDAGGGTRGSTNEASRWQAAPVAGSSGDRGDDLSASASASEAKGGGGAVDSGESSERGADAAPGDASPRVSPRRADDDGQGWQRAASADALTAAVQRGGRVPDRHSGIIRAYFDVNAPATQVSNAPSTRPGSAQ